MSKCLNKNMLSVISRNLQINTVYLLPPVGSAMDDVQAFIRMKMEEIMISIPY
jgi:hypothetical protein